jgi:hypothetical protein
VRDNAGFADASIAVHDSQGARDMHAEADRRRTNAVRAWRWALLVDEQTKETKGSLTSGFEWARHTLPRTFRVVPIW